MTITDASPASDALQRSVIDRSVRLPVLFFFMSGLAWLLISMVLGLIASIKMHSPEFLGSHAWLTYGRVHPAHLNSLIYGWVFQAGMGTSIWLMARLCRTPLKSTALLIVAGHFWNLGVTVGVLGILFGKGTSMEWLDFPKYTWPILFVSYSIVAGFLVVMFKARRDGHIYIAQWYLLAACFWFPWIYLTANILIHALPSAAVVSTAVNAWYVGTLMMFWIVPVGLGVSYYLIPKIVGRSIYSYQLALAGFWGLAILGGWVGVQAYMGGPLPAWMPSVSGAAMIFMIIPMIAIGINHHKTVEGRHFLVQYSPTFRFTFFGCIAFNFLVVLGAALSLFRFGGIAQFTHAESAFQMLGLYGFFTMIMFGAMYFIMPRLMGCEWCSSRMIRFHFWFSSYGTLAMIMVLFVGGVFQGVEQMRVEDPFVLSAEVSRGFMVGRTLSWIFILLANSVFFLHMLLMICRLGRRSKEPTLIHPLSEEHALTVQGANA